MTIKHKKPNQKIKKLVKSLGISQTQVAFDLGISRPKFNSYANGWETPIPATRERIADYFDLTEGELFGS